MGTTLPEPAASRTHSRIRMSENSWHLWHISATALICTPAQEPLHPIRRPKSSNPFIVHACRPHSSKCLATTTFESTGSNGPSACKATCHKKNAYLPFGAKTNCVSPDNPIPGVATRK
eukprot:5880214-Amphidinium_carterae.2